MLNQKHDLHFNIRKLGLPHGLTQKLQGTMPWGKWKLKNSKMQGKAKSEIKTKIGTDMLLAKETKQDKTKTKKKP